MDSAGFTKMILDDYRAFQSTYQQAYEADDPSALNTVAMDPLLSAVTSDVKATAAKHLVYRWAVQLNPRVQGWRPDQSVAVVIDCVRTLAWYSFSTETGKRIASKPDSTTRLYRYAMTYEPASQTWKASAVEGASKC
jgi:hypothetical protein